MKEGKATTEMEGRRALASFQTPSRSGPASPQIASRASISTRGRG
jgi:hypothetical protein